MGKASVVINLVIPAVVIRLDHSVDVAHPIVVEEEEPLTEEPQGQRQRDSEQELLMFFHYGYGVEVQDGEKGSTELLQLQQEINEEKESAHDGQHEKRADEVVNVFGCHVSVVMASIQNWHWWGCTGRGQKSPLVFHLSVLQIQSRQ